MAALTLPSIIQKNQERTTVTRVKKFYSVMNQALLFAIKDNGYVNEWSFIQKDAETGDEVSDKFVGYLKPYMKVSKDCGGKPGCIAAETYKELNNTYWSNYENSKWHYKMVLIDGSYLWIRTNKTECATKDAGTENVCGLIWTDINGKQPPNTIGKDVFIFFILKDRIIPHSNDDCKTTSGGWGCAAYILKNDNMNYLHK